MPRVIVTGGVGFIGSHTVDALIADGYEVVVIDKRASVDDYANQVAIYEIVDIAHRRKVEKIFKLRKPDYVIHCAAEARIQRSIDNPVGTFESNCKGTLNVLLASKDCGVKRIVYSASSSAYGLNSAPQDEDMPAMPLSPYALHKYFGEWLCRIFFEIYGLETVCLRYFNVFGPRQPFDGPYGMVIGKFLNQLKRGEFFTIVPDGSQSRDFVYVSDIVRANIFALKSKKVGKGEVINIGSGKNYSVLELADIIGGPDYPRKFIEPRKGEVRETLADIKKAFELLGWEPKISLEEGIKILKKQID